MSVQRKTVQKQLVREALGALCHPTAEEVYQYVHEKHPTVGRATLYRNLKLMGAEGKVVKLEPPGSSAARFDPVLRPHFHGKCRSCGVLWDIEMEEAHAKALRSKVKDARGFVIEDQELVFVGLCPACKKKMEEEK